MKADYGYIKGYKGADKEHVDVFIGPDLESDLVVIVDQDDPATGKFDECKVVIGVTNVEEAKSLYESNYSKGWKGFRQATPMSVPAFRQWLDRADKRKPVEQYARLRHQMDEHFCRLGLGSPYVPEDEARLAAWFAGGQDGQVDIPDRFGNVYRYSGRGGGMSIERFAKEQPRVPAGSTEGGEFTGPGASIKALVEESLNLPKGRRPEGFKPKTVTYREIDEAEAARIREATGMDVAGFSHCVDQYAVEHILKKHGKRGGC